MSYKEFIDNILTTRGRFACGDEYKERHHIIPKCMGGTNDKDNLIDLYAREHFEAHRLLALENPNVRGLTYAWWCMCNVKGNDKQNRYIPTANEYEEVRKIHSKNVSAMFLGKPKSEKHKKKLSENHANFKGENHPRYGTHLSEEHKRKLSDFAKTRIGDKNPNYGKHTLKGHKLSDETKKKISKANKGRKVSKKARLAVSEANKRRAKKVFQYDLDFNLIKVWDSANDVYVILGINKSSIGECCRGKRKTAGGYHWEYV